MNGSKNHTKNPLDRRSFMRSGLLAGGAATIGAGIALPGVSCAAASHPWNRELHLSA